MSNFKRVLEPESKASWWQAGLFVVGCQMGGFVTSYLGGAFKKQAWSDDTPKPSPWPSQWVFPTVWVVNYTLMGLAAWQVWRQQPTKPVSKALGWFGLHLLHNFSFIPLVNRVKKRSFYTLMDSIAVVLAVITTRQFRLISKPATRLMLPYLGWLCFTTFIKFRWWRLEN